MTRIIALGAAWGAFTGVVGVILSAAVVLGVTFVARVEVTIPGIFSAWPGSADNGTFELRFLPHVTGMATGVVVWAVLVAAVCALVARHRCSRSLAAQPLP